MRKLLLGMLVLFLCTNSFCTNLWRWDCEATNTATSRFHGFESNTSLDSTEKNSGNKSMRIDVIGNDRGNQPTGADFTETAINSLIDGNWFYYRWFMKIDDGFKWGNGTQKVKASRVSSWVWTGYLSRTSVYIGECFDCAPGGDDPSNAEINFPFDNMAGTGWHEYIIAIKKQTGIDGYDGEFHFYVDGNEIGDGVTGMHYTSQTGKSFVESWECWMVYPYWQLNGTASDGGTIWLDDFTTDNVWNSMLYSEPGATQVIKSLNIKQNKNINESSVYRIDGKKIVRINNQFDRIISIFK